MKNLVLIDDKGKYVVECLNDEFEFVHNTMDGSNLFPQKTLAKMFGVTVQSVSQSLKTISKHFPKESRNPLILKLKVNSNNRNNWMLFYDFKVVTMLASRINTPEAFNMLEWIDSSLNTMFNVATGKINFHNMEVLA